MRLIHLDHYKDFIIIGDGRSLTMTTFNKAVGEFANAGYGVTLVGNKKDGTQSILDSK